MSSNLCLLISLTGLFILTISHYLREKDLLHSVNSRLATVRFYLLVSPFNKYFLEVYYEPSVSVGLTPKQNLRQRCECRHVVYL